jgi:ABC-type phosphonate transport system ATPase subunit
MEPEDVRTVVEAAGFVFERIVDVGPYHYGVIFTNPENDKV